MARFEVVNKAVTLLELREDVYSDILSQCFD